MATMDSPSAMMMSSPCRSTKCDGEMVKSPIGLRYGEMISSTSAAAHSPYRQPSGANPPTSTRVAVARLNAPSRDMVRRAPGPPAASMSPVWTTFTTK